MTAARLATAAYPLMLLAGVFILGVLCLSEARRERRAAARAAERAARPRPPNPPSWAACCPTTYAETTVHADDCTRSST